MPGPPFPREPAAMTVPVRPLAALLLTCSAVTFSPAAVADEAAEFEPIFDGTGFDGWFFAPHTDPRAIAAMAPSERAAFLKKHAADGRDHWRVEPGEDGPELVNDGEGPFLWTDRDYADFELRLDWKIEPETDSGVYLRGCPQVQIWDPAGEDPRGHGKAKGSGGLWNNPKRGPNSRGKDPAMRADSPIGEWNTFVIRVVGSTVTVDLNGERVVNEATLENYWDRDLPLFPVGPIILQTHGGETRWRNVEVREIPRAMPESGFLDADGEPYGEGWAAAEPEEIDRGGTAVRPGADLHGEIGPVPFDRPAWLAVQTRLGEPGPLVRFQFDADGTVSADNPLASLADLAPGGAGAAADIGPVPGLWTDVNAAAAAFDPLKANRLYVSQRGGAVSAYLNGTPFFVAVAGSAVGDDRLVAGGPGVRFQQVRDADGRNGPADEAGFTPVPLDAGLPGWTGDTAGYGVAGGVLRCEGGGNVYLPGDHDDFALRFEFKLPPGGNNGVGLRAEHGKDAAYAGMESQILDNTAEVFAGIKPYQAHGSIYGVVPALRGYLAPVGHWNVEEIELVGDRVKVTLNGKIIVDANLCDAAADGTVDGREHPGLLRESGAVGFLGHGAPVEWRNVRVKVIVAGDGAETAGERDASD